MRRRRYLLLRQRCGNRQPAHPEPLWAGALVVAVAPTLAARRSPMPSRIRARLFAGAVLLLVLAGTSQLVGSARADDKTENAEQLLTALIGDVDAHWTTAFRDAG